MNHYLTFEPSAKKSQILILNAAKNGGGAFWFGVSCFRGPPEGGTPNISQSRHSHKNGGGMVCLNGTPGTAPASLNLKSAGLTTDGHRWTRIPSRCKKTPAHPVGQRNAGFPIRVILFCVQSNINNPVKTGEGLDLGG